MPLTVIDQGFPDNWLWRKYDTKFVKSISLQIDKLWPEKQNLLINLTWFGPMFPKRGWKVYQDLIEKTKTFDNLFLIATVDPPGIDNSLIQEMLRCLGATDLYLLGNFDGRYSFNFFAPVLLENFRQYNDSELTLEKLNFKFISYNRKPRKHRVDLVKLIKIEGLDRYGIITLGKPNLLYNPDSNNNLYLSIGEKCEDYVEWGHWYNLDTPDEFGIPHDLLSLHNIEYWKGHFLHIVNATESSVHRNMFVSETQFKPIIGMRPFVINGNILTYQWLRDNGFRTFNHWWPEADLENPAKMHEAIISVLKNITNKSDQEILDIYQEMLPDIRHNRNRFFEFAKEQCRRIENIFCFNKT